MDQNQEGNALTTREEFGATERHMALAETASSAAAAQAQAVVQARYIMALRRPRNLDEVRVRMMRECRRPGFAKVARYNKPVGKGVQGLSIRFAEMGIRCMTNVMPEVMSVFDDAAKKIVRVSVTDLENNITYSQDVTIGKTVERSKPMDDGSYISVRKNSWGKDTFTVPATDDDILNKENALISKAIRTLALRLIPGDIQDECEALIIEIAKSETAKDPDAERKKLADAFAEFGVSPRQLQAYLGQPLAEITPAQLVELRALYVALRDGEATWKTVMENKRAQDGDEGQKPGEVQTNAAGVKIPRSKKRTETAVQQTASSPEGSEPAATAGSAHQPAASTEATSQGAGDPPAAETIDPETGEILGHQGEMLDDDFNEAEVGESLMSAANEAALDFAAQYIQNVRAPGAAERLGKVYADKKAELKAAAYAAQKQATAAATKTASPGYIGMVKAKANAATISEGEIFKKFGMVSWDGCTVARCNEILTWISSPA